MNNGERYLVTTRIKETWPDDRNSELYFPSIEALDKYPDENFPYKNYHILDNCWINDETLSEKFRYLDDLYERTLQQLVKLLNEIHKTNHKEKFWRILLGPWLTIFLFMSYDKWIKISRALKKFKINKSIFLDFDNNFLIPYELKNFIDLTQNDLWNQSINQEICKKLLNIKNIKIIKFLDPKRLNNELKVNRLKGDKDSLLKKILLKFLSFKNNSKYKYLVYRTHTGAINELFLSLKLNQLPIYSIKNENYIKNTGIDYDLRNKFKNLFETDNVFENHLLESIVKNMPKIFVENFEDLVNFSKNANLPKRPSKILSSNGLWYDSFFTYFTGIKNETGTKIIYGQHGGSYGIAKHSWQEEHEKKISNKYLSWGWDDKKSDQRIEKFFIMLKNKKYNWSKKKDRLLILLKHRKIYLQAPDSFITCETHMDYLKFLSPFLFSLRENIKKKTILRLTYKDFKTNNFDFFSNLKNSFIFERKKTLEEACDESRLVINTCNSTTFLETMASNIPTILVVNKKNNPLRNNASKIFDKMMSNNLIFYDSKKASEFINNLWTKDIKDWWQEKNIQKVIKDFQNEFAKPTNNIVNELKKQILN